MDGKERMRDTRREKGRTRHKYYIKKREVDEKSGKTEIGKA